MSSCGGGVGVHVQSAGHGGLGFASHHPNDRCRKTNYYKEIHVVFSFMKVMRQIQRAKKAFTQSNQFSPDM